MMYKDRLKPAVAAVVLVASVLMLAPAAGADGSITLYRSEGRCEVVANYGVGLQGDGQGTISVAAGPGPVVAAYLEWIGFDDTSPDLIPRGGDRADSELTVNGVVIAGVQPPGDAGYAPSGLPESWYSWYADIGPTGSGLVADANAMTLDVSGYESPIDRFNNGASLIVVYDAAPCVSTNLVEVRTGVDYYWAGLADGGGFSLPMTFDFAPSDTDRVGQFFLNHAGTDSTQVECRGDALWLAAGSGDVPAQIVTSEGPSAAAYGVNGGVEGLDDPFGGESLPCTTVINPSPDIAPAPDHPYPGGAADAPYRVTGFETTFAPEWTTIRVDIVIPAEATWLVLQLESEGDQNGESGASSAGGTFVLGSGSDGDTELPIDVELVKGVAASPEGPFVESLDAPVGSTVWWQVVVEAKETDGSNPLGDVTGLVVADVLPAGLGFVGASGDGTYDSAAGSWSIGDLAAGESASLVIETTVDIAGPIVNLAEVTEHDQPDIDSTPGNGPQDPAEDDDDRAEINNELVDVELVDVELNKLVDGVDGPVNRTAGAEIVYTVDVVARELSPDGVALSDVTGLVVSDVLPPDVTFVSATGDGSYDPDSGNWTIGDLAAGTTARLDITVTIDDDSSLEFANVAEVTAHDQPDIDSTPGNGPQDPPEDDDDRVVVKLPSVSGGGGEPDDPGGGIIPATGAGSSSLGFIGLLILILGLDLVLMSFSIGRLEATWRFRR